MDCPICGTAIKPGDETCAACGATTKHVRLIPTGCAASGCGAPRMAAAGGDMTIVFLVSFLAGSLFGAAVAFAVLAERRGKTDIIPIILVSMVGVAVFWLIVRWAKSMRRKRWINP